MALDVYSTPACSDEPERIFSQGGALLIPRRRQLTGDHVQEILCLRSWQRSGIVTLDGALFEQAVRRADGISISDQLPVPSNHPESEDDLLYHDLEE
jgi:hypothetical protein